MTVILDSSSVSDWFAEPSNAQVTITPKEQGPQALTGLQEKAYERLASTVQRIAEAAKRTPSVQPRALVNLVRWLSTIPLEMPAPFVAIGDDGSISSEWDGCGSSLHVTFFDDTNEVYFFNPEGEEWEATVHAVDKLSEAMLTIAQCIQR
jgi:hypothetical protein